jgi:hypothetical protein
VDPAASYFHTGMTRLLGATAMNRIAAVAPVILTMRRMAFSVG